jgi:hypothetical protein
VFSILQQSGKCACLMSNTRFWSHEGCEQPREGNVNTVIPETAAFELEALIVWQSRRRPRLARKAGSANEVRSFLSLVACLFFFPFVLPVRASDG